MIPQTLLSQTNYTGIQSKIYHFNRQKLGSSSKTGYPGCTDNPTRPNPIKKKGWPGAPFSVTFQSRPTGLPDKKLSVHSPSYSGGRLARWQIRHNGTISRRTEAQDCDSSVQKLGRFLYSNRGEFPIWLDRGRQRLQEGSRENKY